MDESGLFNNRRRVGLKQGCSAATASLTMDFIAQGQNPSWLANPIFQTDSEGQGWTRRKKAAGWWLVNWAPVSGMILGTVVQGPLARLVLVCRV
jgi:hypothetical protein